MSWEIIKFYIWTGNLAAMLLFNTAKKNTDKTIEDRIKIR